MEALLIAELGPGVLPALGGATSKLAAMKAKLRGGRPAAAARTYEVFEGLDAATAGRVRAAVAAGRVACVRCARADAERAWPAVAAACAAAAADDAGANAHVARGSLVACAGDAAWCLGGWASQRATQRAAAALVAEARARAAAGRRDFFVCRPTAAFGAAERAARAAHLFASVADAGATMRLDEEAAYSASNETSAAKVAAVARAYEPSCVVDATACVGGNAIAFARAGADVVACEIDPRKAAMLRHNVARARACARAPLGAVRVVVGDCVAALPALQNVDFRTAVVFADPPWGGRRYATAAGAEAAAGVHLKGAGTVAALVDVCARLGAPRLLLKVPQTFDAASLARASTVAEATTHDLSEKVLLVDLALRPPPPAAAAAAPREAAKKRRRPHRGRNGSAKRVAKRAAR